MRRAARASAGQDGEIAIGGRLPISTMGGLKARGHPVGATGVYQIVEVVQQLTGQAGANQVQGATHRHGAEHRRQRRDGRHAHPGRGVSARRGIALRAFADSSLLILNLSKPINRPVSTERMSSLLIAFEGRRATMLPGYNHRPMNCVTSRRITIMSIPRNWRTRQQRYSLKAEVCENCGKAIFPPRDVCPHCAAAEAELDQSQRPW